MNIEGQRGPGPCISTAAVSDIWTDGEWSRLVGRTPCAWKTPVTPRPVALGPRRSPPAIRRSPPTLVKPPVIPRAPRLSSLEEVSGLRELPGVPLTKARTLRPVSAAQVARATDSLIATMVTLPGAGTWPSEATGEIDTNPLAPHPFAARGVARRAAGFAAAAAAALVAALGIAALIASVSVVYVGAEWLQAGLVAAAGLAAAVAAGTCRLVAGRGAGWTVIGAGVLGLAVGWAARLAIAGGATALDALAPGALLAAMGTGVEHAAELLEVQLLLVWTCEAILLLWLAVALGSRPRPPVAGRSA